MRHKDRSILIRAIILFSVSIGGCLLVVWAFWSMMPEIFSFFWLVFFWLFFSGLMGYFIASYALAPLFKTNRLLDFLLKDTLHELNIPLSVIKANLQMLVMEEKEEKNLKRLNRIALASDDLHLLYKEIDYYIKREIREELQEVFDLKDVVYSVIDKCHDIAKGTAIEATLVNVELFADKHGFAKVISNILSNALKYNQNDQPIRIYQEGKQLIIKDSGIGMNESELFLVFDRYYQIDTNQEGFGIGLSIVKAYCDDFKIGLKINSQKMVGTEVILDLSNLMLKR
ncbi:MAG: HAMP domain-containing sensor histidine kinase [Sulfurospirillaceae bacterium]|nr:HAMP domain-containing sensor histidine kinase [Sulfurospirillaceae bacterium]MDD2825427.1 HAMP domain-containing sensor histidine kinase [Sulfurospirillaceae bacterium]